MIGWQVLVVLFSCLVLQAALCISTRYAYTRRHLWYQCGILFVEICRATKLCKSSGALWWRTLTLLWIRADRLVMLNIPMGNPKTHQQRPLQKLVIWQLQRHMLKDLSSILSNPTIFCPTSLSTIAMQSWEFCGSILRTRCPRLKGRCIQLLK